MAAITRTTRLGLFVLGFLTATGVEAVRADEAYLCEGGRIVKVAPGKLEELKRTDPCIGAYYGLKIGAGEPKAEGRLETGALAPPPAPAPVKARPAPVASRPAPVVKATAAARVPAIPTAVKGPVPAPRAANGTDYRNVVLLNAAPGSAAVFRHER